MLGSTTAGISTAVERQTGFYDRLRITPVGVGAAQVGRRAADGTRLAIFALVLSVAAWINGATVLNWPLGLLLAMGFAAWWGVAYGGLAFALCLRTGGAEAAQAITPLFFPLLFMSTAFVPHALLPGWLSAVATWNPMTYVCDVIRAGFSDQFVFSALWRACVGTAALTIVTSYMIRSARRAVTQV
jgi:ABC-2 type transport system permease protein